MQFGRQLLSNSMYRLLNLAVVFAINVLLARLMKAEGYGIFSLLVANVTLLNLVTGFGADSAITYQLASGKMVAGKISFIISCLLVIQGIVVLVIETVINYNAGHYWIYYYSLWIGVIYLLVVSLQEKITAMYNGKGFYLFINQLLFITNSIILGIITVLYLSADSDTEFYIRVYIGLSFCQVLVLVILFYFRAKENSSWQPIRATELKTFFSYSLVAFITNCIQFLAYRVDYWFIDHYRDKEQLGLYVLAVKLSQLFWILPIAFASIIFPATAKVTGGKLQHNLPALIRFMNLLNITGALLALVIIPWILPLLFGEEFRPSVHPLFILLPGVILFCIATILAAFYAGINKLKVNLTGSILCFVLILVLDIVLIPQYGISGAAIASSVGYGTTGLYYLFRFSVESGNKVTRLLLPVKDDWKYIKQLTGAFLK